MFEGPLIATSTVSLLVTSDLKIQLYVTQAYRQIRIQHKFIINNNDNKTNIY